MAIKPGVHTKEQYRRAYQVARMVSSHSVAKSALYLNALLPHVPMDVQVCAIRSLNHKRFLDFKGLTLGQEHRRRQMLYYQGIPF